MATTKYIAVGSLLCSLEAQIIEAGSVLRRARIKANWC